MDKWDSKEGNFDQIIPLIKQWMEKESKDKPQIHHLSLNLTTEQLKKVSEALKS